MSATETDAAATAAAAAQAASDKAAADAAAAEASKPKFTQADLDRLISQEKAKAKDSGSKELLSALGVTDLEAAKAAIAAQRAAEEANKSDLQKAQEENARLAAEAVAAKAEAKAATVRAALEGALRDAGVTGAKVALAVRAVGNIEVEAVEGAITDLKAATPEWFAPAKGGTGGGAADASAGAAGAGNSTDVTAGMSPAERSQYIKQHYGRG